MPCSAVSDLDLRGLHMSTKWIPGPKRVNTKLKSLNCVLIFHQASDISVRIYQINMLQDMSFHL